MALRKQVIPIRIKGLDTKNAQELGPITDIDNISNLMAVKTTDGGFEFRKRFGVTSLTKNIAGGGTVGTGFKICSLNNELLITDGTYLYSYDSTNAKWVKRGYVSDVVSTITTLSTSNDTDNNSGMNSKIDVDVAYQGGFACFVTSRASGTGASEWYVIDRSTGSMVGNGPVNASSNAGNTRVVGIANAFYIFYYTGAGTNLSVKKIDIATPNTIGSSSNAATNYNGANAPYDVIADVTNSRILFCYQNNTPTTTIAVWNTNMTAGTATAYATRNPDLCIGFLDDSAPLNVAIGTSATGVRLLTFNTGTLVVSADTLVDGAATDAVACTGYNSGNLNVQYTRAGASKTRDDVTWGWRSGFAVTQIMRSVSIHSRPITAGTQGGAGTRYMLVGHNEDTSVAPGSGDRVRALFLLQMDQDATQITGFRVGGTISHANWGTWAIRFRGLGSGVKISSTSLLFSAPLLEGPTASLSGAMTFPVASIDIDLSGTNTGNPVAFNNEMFFPGSATRVYDGRNVFENGYYHRPDQPTLTQVVGGGTMTAGTVQYCIVYSYIDSNGKLWRSSPSAISSLAINANDRITVVVYNCRITDRNQLLLLNNIGDIVDENVRIELYATKPNGSVFYIASQFFNSPSTDSQTVTLSSDVVVTSEILYTQGGALPNEYPGNVQMCCVHGSRMFFMCGDRSVWFTREIENDEDFPAPSSVFRIQVGSEFGQLTGIASMDTGLVISRRTRMQLLTGQGPAKDGGGAYQYPANIPTDVGFKNIRAFAGVQDGIIFQSQKGFQFLSRSGNVEPVYGAEDIEVNIALSGTITSAVALDTLPFVVMSSSSAYTLVWDYQFKIWYVWFNAVDSTQLNSIAATKWQGSWALLKSDGTVNVQGAGWSDNGNAILSSLALGWMPIGEVFGNARIYSLQYLVKLMNLTTLSSILRYDYNLTVSDAAKTITVTTTDSGIFVSRPGRRLIQSLYFGLSETSTLEGFRVTAFALEIGMKRGSRKQASGRFLT